MSDSYYIKADAIRSNSFTLVGAEAHHAATVIRMKVGATLALFDGEGNRYKAIITDVSPHELSGTIITTLPNNESPFSLTLACALIKKERFEWMLEKAVELGVSHIQPIITARSIIKIPPARLDKKIKKWRSQILTAVKQCQRSRIPEISPPLELRKFSWQQYKSIILPCMVEHNHTVQDTTCISPVVAFVGPEGGFTSTEIDYIQEHGGEAVTLGSRRLRAETAATIVISEISNRLEG